MLNRRNYLIIFSTALLIFSIFGFLTVSPTAHAAPTQDMSAGKKFTMHAADCNHLSKAPSYVQTYVAQHNYCKKPHSVTPGDCGVLLVAVQQANLGQADFIVEIFSSVGPITYVSFDGNWVNYTRKTGSYIGDTEFPNEVNWQYSRKVNTGSGDVQFLVPSVIQVTASSLCFGSGSDETYIS